MRINGFIIKHVIAGDVVFDKSMPHRFAKLGDVCLYRNMPTDRWHIVFNGIDQFKLSYAAHVALAIASKYAGKNGKDNTSE